MKILFITKNVLIVGKHFLRDIYGITVAFQINNNSLIMVTG